MTLLSNIMDRFVIHFASSTSIFVAFYFFLDWLHRRHATLAKLFVAAVFVFAVAAPREAYDVAMGQPLVKAFTDYASWALGAAASAYGIYRLRKLRS